MQDYLAKFENSDSTRTVTIETQNTYDFTGLSKMFPGLKETDIQGWYVQVENVLGKKLSVEALYAAAKVTKETVGTKTEGQLVGLAAFYQY